MVTKYDYGHIIFQAVYIQTISMSSGVFKPYVFTFQSGYIQIEIEKMIDFGKVPLHSNLVIFKSHMDITGKVPTILYIPIWLYSNLGRHRSTCQAPVPLHSNLVIFKWELHFYIKTPCQLYIPIWLYSNLIAYIYNIAYCPFTFQSGYIQIRVL